MFLVQLRFYMLRPHLSISIGKLLFQVGLSCGFPLLLILCLPKIPSLSHGNSFPQSNFSKFNAEPKLLKCELGAEFWNANWFPITLFISIYWNSLFHPFLIEMVHNKIFELTFHCGNKGLTFRPNGLFKTNVVFPKENMEYNSILEFIERSLFNELHTHLINHP